MDGQRLRLTRRGLIVGSTGLALVALLLACLAWIPGCPQTRTSIEKHTVIDETPSPQPRQMVMRVRLVSADNNATIAVDGPLRILGDGQPTSNLANLPDSRVALDGSVWRIGQLESKAASIELLPAGNGSLRVNGRRYKGFLRLVRTFAGYAAVNCVGMEDYVAGVVTAEMPSNYPIEALKAQAIIARTYAAWEKATRGNPDYDVADDVSSQVYAGVEHDRGVGRQATDATRGIMLVFGPPGQERIFATFFHSTCGGGTMSVRYFKPKVKEIPPLAGGVECKWCRGSKWFDWPAVSVPRSDVWSGLRRIDPRLPADGRNVAIGVDKLDQFGRILTIKLSSAEWSAPIVMLGDELRLGIGASRIPSMLVELNQSGQTFQFRNGHGYGHGVGLCQVGAGGLAREGRSAGQILRHYYPQAGLKRAY